VLRAKNIPMVRTLLNIQLLSYGMTYLMILEKLPILTNLKTFYYLGMEMNANVMHVKKNHSIKVFSIFILFILFLKTTKSFKHGGDSLYNILKHYNAIVHILLICRDGTFAICKSSSYV
jgi:hypothetical protein